MFGPDVALGARASRWAVALLVLAGIDGFKLLEPLRELGARPFFLVYLIGLGWLISRQACRFDGSAFRQVLVLEACSLLGFILVGSLLRPFGDKTPLTQFVAHSVLFMVGFSPLFLRLDVHLGADSMVKVARSAMMLHGVFLAVDGLALMLDLPRPFESSFLGAVERRFPTGLFSEPSYVAAYFGMLLPVTLLRARPVTILAVAGLASLLFFLGDVRSFFFVFGPALLSLIVLRWGINVRSAIAMAAAVGGLAFAAVTLNLLTVEESLSSAYRLGNTLSFLGHAFGHDLLVGDGFGATHFLYPTLDFPAFLYLSREFDEMLGGAGNRVPVFNLWVRLFVELGVLPTAWILWRLFRAVFTAQTTSVAKVLAVGAFAFSLSTDSYIYGMFTLALAMVFTLRLQDKALAPHG